jgi:hypothetical protein
MTKMSKIMEEEEERLREIDYIQAEKEHREYMELQEMMRLPAKIVIIDKDKQLKDEDKIGVNTLPF